jgi:predicted nucleic acid-binding protein
MSAEFVDTNVLVYAHDSTAGAKRRIAVELLLRLFDTGQGRLSTQVLMEFFVTVTKKLPRPMGLRAACAVIEDLGTWQVFRPHVTDVIAAGQIADRYAISFWDALVVRAAEELDAAVLWSEDLSDGQIYQGVTVRNPFSRTE